jgi:hypothetical protein
VRNNDVRLVAILSLSSDELERGITEKRASIATLRDGVIGQPPSGVRIEVRDPNVRFEIVRIGAAPGAQATPDDPTDAIHAQTVAVPTN